MQLVPMKEAELLALADYITKRTDLNVGGPGSALVGAAKAIDRAAMDIIHGERGPARPVLGAVAKHASGENFAPEEIEPESDALLFVGAIGGIFPTPAGGRVEWTKTALGLVYATTWANGQPTPHAAFAAPQHPFGARFGLGCALRVGADTELWCSWCRIAKAHSWFSPAPVPRIAAIRAKLHSGGVEL